MDTNTETTNTHAATQERPGTIVVHIDQLKADPVLVANERRQNAYILGATGAFVGGAVSGLIAQEKLKWTKPGIGMAVLVTTVVAGIAGSYLGRSQKTSEEERSEILVKAAQSGKFEESIKKEMEKRDQEKELEGYLHGRSH